MSYQPKVYHDDGGNRMVVGNGGSIKVLTGGKILPNSGTQAAHIADVNAATALWSTAERARFNDVLVALESVGILATS